MTQTQQKSTSMTYRVSPANDDTESRAVRRRLAWALRIILVAVIIWQGMKFSATREARDEAERLQAEAEVDRDRQLRRVELIILSAPVALIMCDEDQRIIVYNPEAKEMFGWEQDELIGKSADVLLPEEMIEQHQTAFIQHIDRVRESDEDFMMQRTGIKSHARHKNGTLIPVEVAIRVIKYGETVEFIASIRHQHERPKISVKPIPSSNQRNRMGLGPGAIK